MKFRLKHARTLGEDVAKNAGFTKLPIDPFKIAKDEEICVEAKAPELKGMSGCIVFNNDGAGIIYSTHIQNEGFQRFTVAHELGHYFIDGHPEEILNSGGTHVSKAGFTEGNISIEIEADHFASGLLMPSFLVKKELEETIIGLDGIIKLSEKAFTSLTSSAIRAAECAPYPIAIVVSKGDEVQYCFLSESFKNLGKLHMLRKGDKLPASKTSEFNIDINDVFSPNRESCESDLYTWFDGPSNIKLDEEIIGLGSYGLTLTVLSSEALAEDPYEVEDEEQELVDKWTPKFAYGR